ncbi:hypothetical protein [Bdellovibrio sp. HCB337]|uniref:hypothetical protein n=1 Tax=Bdellovibrio sp. HCB337 TaxID=3394358 RepID=UPI0039A5F772
MKSVFSKVITVFLAISGIGASVALAAPSCQAVFADAAKFDPATEYRLERASLVVNRPLTDVQSAALLETSASTLNKKEIILLLREAGFKAAEAKALIESQVALPPQSIRFDSQQLKNVEEFLRDPDNKLGLTLEQKENFLQIIKSESPEMGSTLAKAVGFDVLGHKTNGMFFSSIAQRGAIVPGTKVKDRKLKERATAYAQDFGSTGFGTFMYSKAFFQPFGPNWKNTKANGGYFFIFDLKLFDDPTVDFNNFYGHFQEGARLRENPAGFLLQLLMARGSNQSELKTEVGISLRYVKYIVVPPTSYAWTLKTFQEQGIEAPLGRTWEEVLVPSDLILGDR